MSGLWMEVYFVIVMRRCSGKIVRGKGGSWSGDRKTGIQRISTTIVAKLEADEHV